MILSLLIKSPYKIKIIGDKSLSKRDFSRVIKPLKNIGVNFYPVNKSKLPIFIKGSNYLRPIKFKGSCIFIHLTKDYKPTAGCIALKKKDFLIMLKLINKKTKIQIN